MSNFGSTTIACLNAIAAVRAIVNKHDITTVADGARSVFAMDLDGDGDIDVLSASSYAALAFSLHSGIAR